MNNNERNLFMVLDFVLNRMHETPNVHHNLNAIIDEGGYKLERHERQTVSAILLNKGFINVIDEDVCFLKDEAGEFIVRGGFTRQIERENIETRLIEENIKTAKYTRQLGRYTLRIGILTLIAVAAQVFIALSQFLISK